MKTHIDLFCCMKTYINLFDQMMMHINLFDQMMMHIYYNNLPGWMKTCLVTSMVT